MTTNTDLLQKSESIEDKIDRVFNEVCDGHVPEALEDLAIDIGHELEDLRAALQPSAGTRELVEFLKGQKYEVQEHNGNAQIAEHNWMMGRCIIALEQQAQGGGWMPIETAPKDRGFLGYQKLTAEHWLIAPMYYEGGRVKLLQYHNDNTEHEANPSHWKEVPLPPAPDRSEER